MNNLLVIGCNVNGIKQKLHSLEFIVQDLSPSVIILQEIKIIRKSTIVLPNYKSFFLIKSCHSGGLLIAVNNDLKPILIYEGTQDCQVLVVQIETTAFNIRVIAGYGPQETDTTNSRLYRDCIEENINRAKLQNCEILLQEDANGKIARGINTTVSDLQTYDTSDNGSKLISMVRRNNLYIENFSQLCHGGPHTRERVFADGRHEKSTIDYIITSHRLHNLVIDMKIDSELQYPLVNYNSINYGKDRPVYSDHFTLLALFNLQTNQPSNTSIPRREIYLLRNPQSLKTFNSLTDNNNGNLTNCINQERDLQKATTKWLRLIDNIIRQSFMKVRVTSKPPKNSPNYQLCILQKELQILKDMRKTATDNTSPPIDIEINWLYTRLSELIDDTNKKRVEEECAKLEEGGGFNVLNIWKMKKRLFPDSDDPPMAILDDNGTLITSENEIMEKMYNEFIYRLRSRDSHAGYEDIRTLKEQLCEMRLKRCKLYENEDWSKDDVLNCIRKFKNNKAKDPLGHVKELYKNMGKDGINSIVLLLNRIKRELYLPQELTNSDIKVIYKGKGDRADILNNRGIFILPILRNLLDMLIYEDEKDIIFNSMGCYQVGAQKGRNIRDNTFVIHAVCHEARKTKNPIDVTLYDVAQCFDSLWIQETINDLYESGVKNKNLNLVHIGNKMTKMGIRNPTGTITRDRVELNNIVMQGSVLGPILCSNQISKNSTSALNNGCYFMYKNIVPVPPLSMVDDIATISPCNKRNGNVDIDIECDVFAKKKKITFKPSKCATIHIGSKECLSEHLVDNKTIEQKELATYLADTISNNEDQLFEKRLIKARLLSIDIGAMTAELGAGRYYHHIALTLFNSMFINAFTTNMETWHGFTIHWIKKFENIEVRYLRNILEAHPNTPIEGIYLELGIIPLRYHIFRKRISYFNFVLARDESEITKKILECQIMFPTKDDFYQQYMDSLKMLHLNQEDIDSDSNISNLKPFLKRKAELAAHKYLIDKANSHSKMEYLKSLKDTDSGMAMSDYLKSTNLSKSDKCLLFRARTRMLPCKANFKSAYNNIICDYCKLYEDDQTHILNCPITSVNPQKYDNMSLFSKDCDVLKDVANCFRISLNNRETVTH